MRVCEDSTASLGNFEQNPSFSEYNDLAPKKVNDAGQPTWNIDQALNSYDVKIYSKQAAINAPWFLFNEMTYKDSTDSTDRRPNCQLVYSHSSA